MCGAALPFVAVLLGHLGCWVRVCMHVRAEVVELPSVVLCVVVLVLEVQPPVQLLLLAGDVGSRVYCAQTAGTCVQLPSVPQVH